MPWDVRKSDSCPASKPWGVFKEGSSDAVACHPSEDAAREHQKALYANEKKMDTSENSNNSEMHPNNTNMSAKELHDRWLKSKPEDMEHSCVFCEVDHNDTGGTGDSMSEKTFTEADLVAAVAAATKPLQDQVDQLTAEKDAEAVEAKVAEVRTELEAKIAELQSQLDIKVAEVTDAKTELENVNAYLKAEADREAEESAKAERLEQRVAVVKENASYTDEYVEANKGRWAEMAEADFETFIDALKTAGVKKTEGTIPEKTGLSAGSETASRDESKSSLRAVLDVRRAGLDARRLV